MNLIYQNGIIPTINKPTRVTEKLQQQLIISLIIVLQKILRYFSSQMFQIIFQCAFFFLLTNLFTKNDVIYHHKRIINEEKIEDFLQNLY